MDTVHEAGWVPVEAVSGVGSGSVKGEVFWISRLTGRQEARGKPGRGGSSDNVGSTVAGPHFHVWILVAQFLVYMQCE
jgi:hypothetical protein